jgi:outer membrane receptor protein involved in Fe transport
MTDEIGWNPVTIRNENLDDTRRQGAEADVEVRGRLGSVQAAYTFTEARFVDGPNDGSDVPLVPQHRVTLGARIPLPAGLRFDATGRYVGGSYLGGDNANAGDQLSDHVVVDLFLRCVCAAVPGLEAYVGAENVFNEEYAAIGYTGGGWAPDACYPAAGTTFRAGVFHRF